ncbi:uncharacterized protein [Triticum aestivum]|uniref:uncharacterized protein n=1 Tax=Triticum aestivum TaxID=4565 RepID=UPI001D027B67|nr:uncharacterized protein LOC123114694 [Triticum aestivum]
MAFDRSTFDTASAPSTLALKNSRLSSANKRLQHAGQHGTARIIIVPWRAGPCQTRLGWAVPGRPVWPAIGLTALTPLLFLSPHFSAVRHPAPARASSAIPPAFTIVPPSGVLYSRSSALRSSSTLRTLLRRSRPCIRRRRGGAISRPERGRKRTVKQEEILGGGAGPEAEGEKGSAKATTKATTSHADPPAARCPRRVPLGRRRLCSAAWSSPSAPPSPPSSRRGQCPKCLRQGRKVMVRVYKQTKRVYEEQRHTHYRNRTQL